MEEAKICVDQIEDLDQCIDQFSRLEHRQIPALLQVQRTQAFQIDGYIIEECRGFLSKHRLGAPTDLLWCHPAIPYLRVMQI